MGQYAELVSCEIWPWFHERLTGSFESWRMLKYPMPKEKRIALAKLFFHVCTTPGMPTHIVASCADTFVTLTRSRKKVSIEDLRLPWKPIYKILSKDLFLTRRQFEIRCGDFMFEIAFVD